MRRVTKLEKIRNLRPIDSKEVPRSFDEDLSEYLASEISDRLKVSNKVKKNTIKGEFGNIVVKATDAVIVIQIPDDYILRWAFDGDLTDSDINEISREVNGRLEQSDANSKSAKDAERVNKMATSAIERVIRSSEFYRSLKEYFDEVNSDIPYEIRVECRNVDLKPGWHLTDVYNDTIRNLGLYKCYIHVELDGNRGKDLFKDLGLDLPLRECTVYLDYFDPHSGEFLSFLEFTSFEDLLSDSDIDHYRVFQRSDVGMYYWYGITKRFDRK